MFSFHRFSSGTAALMALSLTTSAIAPFIAVAPSFAQETRFSDVSPDYWAAGFITQLAQRNVIKGDPNGTFRPESPVTRAEFAAMMTQANQYFRKQQTRGSVNFSDVPTNAWYYSAVQNAYGTGFLSGYPGNLFRPTQNIPREQVLVSLANGLGYSPNGTPSTILQYYNDASSISGYAQPAIAAATERQIVVDYPDTKTLAPTQTATRAQVAAFIYQALVSSGQATAINSPYIVALNGTPTTPTPTPSSIASVPAGTVIPVKYDKGKKILVTPNEKQSLTLTVAQNIVTSDGTVLIPAGSQVNGQLQPAQNGSQFVAQQLVLPNGQKYDFNASSQVVTKTQEISKGINVGDVVRDAVLGSGAAAAISAVTGNRDITAWKVLTGTGAGTLIGLFTGKNRVKVVSIDPNADLNLTVNSALNLNS
jgi:hypothetical protein